MFNPFDIFRTEIDGSVMWRESARTLDGAKARVRELLASAPGDYILFNQQTGAQLVIKLDFVNVAEVC
jgi:hypothetical protein